MMRKLLFICGFLLLSLPSGAQVTNDIYRVVDRLAGDPSPGFVDDLEKNEALLYDLANTPEEYLALLILQCNMGYYFHREGMLQKAVSAYEKAWQNYRDNNPDGYDIIEFCLKPLGNLYTVSGDFIQAENTIKSYLFLARAQDNKVQETAAILNLSVVYHNTGNFRTAIRLIEEHLQHPVPDAGRKARLLNNLASNYFALGEYDRAETLLEQAVQGSPGISAQMYRNMAQFAKNRNEFVKASEYMDLAESALKQQDFTARELARLYTEKAELSSLQQDYGQAESLLFRALDFLLPGRNNKKLPSHETLYAENTFISVFDALGALAGDMETALRCYEQAFYVTELIGEHIISQEAKMVQQANNRSRSEKCIALLYNAYKNTSTPRYLERAFEYAERSKASVLKDVIVQRSLAERFPEDSLLQMEQALSARREITVNRLVRAQLNQKSPDSIPYYIQKLNELHLHLRTLRREIDKKYPRPGFPAISVSGIRERLRKDRSDMIVYFSGKNHLYSFIFSGDSTTLKRTGFTAQSEDEIRRFISFFNTPSAIHNDVSSYTGTAYTLYKKLIPPSHPGEHLVIIPDGLLHFIPFEALLTSPAQSTSYSAMPFLVKQKKLAYHTSAGLYVNEEQAMKNRKLLGVFPFSGSGSRELRYSGEEARHIESIMDARILSRKDAGKENFLKQAGDYGIIHLSTHAAGGNFTVPASIEFYDDTMLLHELYGLRLNPDLVVLSACETGIGKLQRGEGAMSIARGFQYAGAQKLLFSLWQVNDRATANIMTSFYENYTKYKSASEACYRSKIAYLENKSIPAAQKSPYYWSGFVYYGTVQRKNASFSHRVALLGIAAITLSTALFIGFFQDKKRKGKNKIPRDNSAPSV